MSDTRFTASNGLYVENGQTYLPDGTRATADLSSVRAVLLIEYGAHKAQAERDAELGRWRSVEHPDWVVYPLEREDHVDLLNERNLHRLTIPRSAFYHIEEEDEAYAVKAEYWAAHPVPEPKPWEQAQPGEVWELTTESRVDEYATILGKSMDLMTFDNVVYFMPTSEVRLPKLGLTATIITAGVRKYPEVSE